MANEFVEKLKFLSEIKDTIPVSKKKFGIIKLTKGWISVDDEGECYHVLWTNGKHSHSTCLGENAYGADIDKSTGQLYKQHDWTGAWVSAISLHPVRSKEEKKAKAIFEFIREKIEIAYEWQIKKGEKA